MIDMSNCIWKYVPESIHQAYGEIKFWIRFHFFKKGLLSEEFRGLMGYDINWKNPRDINEKINWLKLNSDTTEWTRLADKYLVRKYVKEKIGEQYLTKLYGVWNIVEDIDFKILPNRFIFKTNHGAGTVLPVLSKNNVDKQEIRKKLKAWLKLKYGYKTIEPHYLRIKPLIIAEELLENDAEFSSSLVDYKIYCMDGVPELILVCADRQIGRHCHFSYFDTNWNPLPDILNTGLKGTHIDYPRPDCLQELLICASKLSKGFPQVRVDFYIVKGKPIFGEMTFTSNGGYDNDITRDYSIELGNKIKLQI